MADDTWRRVLNLVDTHAEIGAGSPLATANFVEDSINRTGLSNVEMQSLEVMSFLPPFILRKSVLLKDVRGDVQILFVAQAGGRIEGHPGFDSIEETSQGCLHANRS